MSRALRELDPLTAHVRAMTETEYTSLSLAADTAVLRSLVNTASKGALLATLKEFFDFEPLPVVLYERFHSDGVNWPRALREQLAEALVFSGLDEEAQDVIDTLN